MVSEAPPAQTEIERHYAVIVQLRRQAASAAAKAAALIEVDKACAAALMATTVLPLLPTAL